jgi:ribosome hibernation promoting factor
LVFVYLFETPMIHWTQRNAMHLTLPGGCCRKEQPVFIDTRASQFALTDSIVRHVESRVRSSLAPVERWVMSVTARLQDVNGDRGGIDKRCKLVAVLTHRGTVVAQATHNDLYAAVDEAARRIRRAAVRAVKRPYARDRQDPQRPGALVHV